MSWPIKKLFLSLSVLLCLWLVLVLPLIQRAGAADLIKYLYLVENTSEPASPFPSLMWWNPSNGEMKLRNAANTGWIMVGDTANEVAGGYSLSVYALNASTTTDAQTLYWGGTGLAPQTTAGICRICIPRAGKIKSAYIHAQAGTAGTNETWEMFIRKNNTSDTSIQQLASNSANRVWSNTALSISVVAGDYIEIKSVNPTWATNPANVRFGGWIFIE